MALNLLADPLDSLQLSGGEEVGVTGSLPSHVTHYVNRNTNKDVSLSTINSWQFLLHVQSHVHESQDIIMARESLQQ